MLLGKLAGRISQEEIETRSSSGALFGKGKVDFEQPCSEHNRWYFLVDQDAIQVSFSSSPLDVTGTLLVKDAVGKQHSLFMCLDPKTEGGGGCRLLPGSTPFCVALGKRLVEFFGGTVCYNNSYEEGEKPGNDLHVPPGEAIFPPALPGDDENKRWYEFENAVHAQKPINSHELEQAQALCRYKKEEETKALIDVLRPLEEYADLQKSTGPSGFSGTSPRYRL